MTLPDALKELEVKSPAPMIFLQAPVSRYRPIEFVSDTEDNDGPVIKKWKQSPRRPLRQPIIKRRRFQDNTYDFDSDRESSSEDERTELDPELESAYPWMRCLPTRAEREATRAIMRGEVSYEAQSYLSGQVKLEGDSLDESILAEAEAVFLKLEQSQAASPKPELGQADFLKRKWPKPKYSWQAFTFEKINTLLALVGCSSSI
ncbi:hypothetical protein JOM56_005445 [Amanita muscaria]